MISDFLHRIARERDADARGARRRPRPVAALLRYAVLGAVALSILPASAAASLPAHAQAKSGTRADSEPQRAPERPTPTNAAADGYGALLAIAPLREREWPSGVVWNHTGLMADGKQFAVTLEMSREQAGHLLLQIITPN